MKEKNRKITKEEASYQQQPMIDKRCGNCVMFHDWRCSLVKGTISIDGYCKFWEMKP